MFTCQEETTHVMDVRVLSVSISNGSSTNHCIQMLTSPEKYFGFNIDVSKMFFGNVTVNSGLYCMELLFGIFTY